MFDSSTSFQDQSVGRWPLIIIGGVLIVLGLIALFATATATVISVVLLGILLLIGGIVEAISAFRAPSMGRAILRVLLGVLTMLAGLLLIVRPVLGAVTLTLFIAWYLVIVGIVKLVESLAERDANWGWGVASGTVSLLLGILLLASWPVTGVYAIGLFLAIELIVTGVAWLLAAFLIPSGTNTSATTPAY